MCVIIIHNAAVANHCLTKDAIDRIACELYQVRWHDMYRMNYCNDQASFFYSNTNSVFDRVAPMEIIPVKSNDRPWVTTLFQKTCCKTCCSIYLW